MNHLLKADGRFAPLPIAASRTGLLGGTVATVGFPDIGLQGFATKLAKGEIASLSGAGDDPRYFQISAPVQPGNSGGALVDERGNFGRAGSPLPAVRPNAKNGAHGVTRPTGCGGGAGGERGVAGGPCGRPPIELRGQEQPAVEFPGIGAGGFGHAQNAGHG